MTCWTEPALVENQAKKKKRFMQLNLFFEQGKEFIYGPGIA